MRDCIVVLTEDPGRQNCKSSSCDKSEAILNFHSCILEAISYFYYTWPAPQTSPASLERPPKCDKCDENERDGNVIITIINSIVINITLLEHDPPAKLSSV